MSGIRRPEILVVCSSEVILYGVTGLLASAGYAVQALPDAWRARRLLASRRFDLVIVGATEPATQQFLAHLADCTPPVKVLALDRISVARPAEISRDSSPTGPGISLLSAVAKLVGVPDPTSGSPGPAAA
jgi:CheY-like chemotaxis protein